MSGVSYQSTARPCPCRSKTSGAMYSGVPQNDVAPVWITTGGGEEDVNKLIMMMMIDGGDDDDDDDDDEDDGGEDEKCGVLRGYHKMT